jgi:hypothetical protein
MFELGPPSVRAFSQPSGCGVYARFREEAGINFPLSVYEFLSKPFQEIAA